MYPTINDYQVLLQHPSVNIKPPHLRGCQVETDPMGMPRARSGGFVLTYCLRDSNKRYAIRCFKQADPEREQRYRLICDFLSHHPMDFFVRTEYIPEGVLWRNAWYPITVMDWVEGDSLSSFLYSNINQSHKMALLSQEFKRVAAELDRLGIAHGDLSPLNILVRNGKMVLIDYDGMYVPALKGQLSRELGNIHFQHPARSENDFGPELDRFSEIVIYLSLAALALQPQLYDEFAVGSEGLILRREDFIRPDQSLALDRLAGIPELTPFVGQFRELCTARLQDMPRLEDFLQNKPIAITPAVQPRPLEIYRSAYPIFNASNRDTLLKNKGDYVTVIGRISDYHLGFSERNGKPYVFLNFGNWRSQCFTVVLWSEALQQLQAAGKDPQEYHDKWVSVNGLIHVYSNQYGSRPEIILDSPADIEIITEEQAQFRLKNAQRVSQAVQPVAPQPEPLPPPKTSWPMPTAPTPVPQTVSPASQPPIAKQAPPNKGLDQSPEVITQLNKTYSGMAPGPAPQTTVKAASPVTPPSMPVVKPASPVAAPARLPANPIPPVAVTPASSPAPAPSQSGTPGISPAPGKSKFLATIGSAVQPLGSPWLQKFKALLPKNQKAWTKIILAIYLGIFVFCLADIGLVWFFFFRLMDLLQP